MKHLAFKIGDMFLIRTKGKNGKPDDVRVCRKSSRIGFVYADEAMLGEVQFDPELDAKVEPISAAGNITQPPSPTVVATALPEDREQKAARLVAESGKAVHSSDCSTSCAPAREPCPCDCSEHQAPAPAAKKPIKRAAKKAVKKTKKKAVKK